MTPAEWIGLAGTVISLTTLMRVVFGEAARKGRQLELLQSIDALRKEISEGYVDKISWRAELRVVRHEFRNADQKVIAMLGLNKPA